LCISDMVKLRERPPRLQKRRLTKLKKKSLLTSIKKSDHLPIHFECVWRV